MARMGVVGEEAENSTCTTHRLNVARKYHAGTVPRRLVYMEELLPKLRAFRCGVEGEDLYWRGTKLLKTTTTEYKVTRLVLSSVVSVES